MANTKENFERANSVVHPVEGEWHHPILCKHGFTPVTKSAIGFVRVYEYVHSDGRAIRCNTGVSSDYWTDPATNKTGYWSTLETYISR